jgi:hypothetical protein
VVGVLGVGGGIRYKGIKVYRCIGV